MAGLIDWNRIEDRTRNLKGVDHWRSPGALLEFDAEYYRIDKWKTQNYRPEVWIEKDALLGVIERVCNRLDISYFSCRGYTSQSEMWRAGRRLEAYQHAGQTPIILHLGDHDPSGKDMTRDIKDRLEMFMGGLTVDRLALNMDQIEQYDPPPNPAKITDTRASAYIAEFGEESWELDALEPSVMEELITSAVKAVRNTRKWNAAVKKEREQRELLRDLSDRWSDVADYLKENPE